MMKEESPFLWLQNWFLSSCDGDWEHDRSVAIRNLDNPGWAIDINLEGTVMEGIEFEELFVDRSEYDWVCCRVEEERFFGYGGPENLAELVEVFKSWVEASSEVFEDKSNQTEEYSPWMSSKNYHEYLDCRHSGFNKVTRRDVYVPHVHDPKTPGGIRDPIEWEIPR